MKNRIILFMTSIFVIALFSCTSSQFATSKRTFKNGHYVAVKKYYHDPVKINLTKKQAKRKLKSETAYSDNNTNRIAEEGINTVTPLNYQQSQETLLATTSKEFVYIPKEEITNVSEVNIISKTSEPEQDLKVHNKKVPEKTISVPIDDKAFVTKKDTVYITKSSETKVEKKKNVAVGGMVCGIIGLFIAGVILGAIAIGVGIGGLVKVKKHPEKYKGKGFAIASLILGIVSFIGGIVVIILILPIL